MNSAVYQGDCVEILKTLPSESIDFVLADPPYLVNYTDRRGQSIANDNPSVSINDVWKEVARVLKPNSLSFSFYSWQRVDVFTAAWSEAALTRVGHVVFPKNYASGERFLRYSHECGFLLSKGTPTVHERPVNDVFNWHYSGNRRHPTEKSVETIKPILEAFTKNGDIILDPYSGSGSTLVAAALLNRRSIGIEIDAGYCEIAKRRLQGVANHVRTVPMPGWVKNAIDRWLTAASVTTGRVFRAVSRHGTVWGNGISENVVWYVVRSCALRLELDHLAPHDLRRTCAKLCHVNGGELEQIQFLLGHASVLTTERYLGCKQNLEEPVNDRFGCLFSGDVDLR